MKKLVLIALAILLCAGAAFAEDEDGGIILRGAAGIMYMKFLHIDYFNFYGFRGGVHGDIMYNMGRFEVGAEVGFYAMEIEWDYDYAAAFEIPVNAVVRMNFDQERQFAAELRGGLWMKGVLAGDATFDVTGNVGARICASVVYLGADYVFASYWFPHPAIAIEAGVKIQF